jgi:hypothetical protein
LVALLVGDEVSVGTVCVELVLSVLYTTVNTSPDLVPDLVVAALALSQTLSSLRMTACTLGSQGLLREYTEEERLTRIVGNVSGSGPRSAGAGIVLNDGVEFA